MLGLLLLLFCRVFGGNFYYFILFARLFDRANTLYELQITYDALSFKKYMIMLFFPLSSPQKIDNYSEDKKKINYTMQKY